MGVSTYLIIGLIVLAGSTYGVKQMQINSLESQNAELREEIQDLAMRNGVAKANISKLRDAIQKQSDSIAAMKESRADALERMKVAMDTSERYRALQRGAVAALAREAGSSCEHGIALIDRELGL